MDTGKEEAMMKHLSVSILVMALAVGLYAMNHSYRPNPETSYVAAARYAAVAPEASAAVKVDNFSFDPKVLTVPVGTTVTWTNRDDVPHNVVSTEQKFKSKTLDTDESFSMNFDQPGTYEYFCSIHPKMTATVKVVAK